MLITIDPGSTLPPYEQIRMQIATLVHTGELQAGTRLPTVRRLAGDLGLAPNTVARSYRELENDQVIDTRGRNGSFVARPGTELERLGQVAAESYLERIAQLGLGPDDAISLLQKAIDRTG